MTGNLHKNQHPCDVTTFALLLISSVITTLISNTCILCLALTVRHHVSHTHTKQLQFILIINLFKIALQQSWLQHRVLG